MISGINTFRGNAINTTPKSIFNGNFLPAQNFGAPQPQALQAPAQPVGSGAPRQGAPPGSYGVVTNTGQIVWPGGGTGNFSPGSPGNPNGAAVPNGFSFGSNGGIGNGGVGGNANNLAGLLPGTPGNLPIYQNAEDKAGVASQDPTHVLNVLNQLQAALGQFGQNSSNIANQANALGNNQAFNPLNLNSKFLTDKDFQSQLNNGVDFFGRLGMSEGLQNINLQRQTANNQLTSTLGQQPGNQSLMGILKNQNFMRSQLAAQPLLSDAQKGTADRIAQAVNLGNAGIQAGNQTQLAQGAYNQQAAISPLATMISSLQPYNNFLDILTNLQGQGRGITSNEGEISTKNFK